MKILNYVVAVALVTGVTACGESQKVEDVGREGVIPEHQLQAMDKAKGTEQLLKDAEEQRRKALDAQDGA